MGLTVKIAKDANFNSDLSEGRDKPQSSQSTQRGSNRKDRQDRKGSVIKSKKKIRGICVYP